MTTKRFQVLCKMHSKKIIGLVWLVLLALVFTGGMWWEKRNFVAAEKMLENRPSQQTVTKEVEPLQNAEMHQSEGSQPAVSPTNQVKKKTIEEMGFSVEKVHPIKINK